MNTLLEAVHKGAEENTIVLSFANSLYGPQTQKWLKCVERLGIHNYVIIALDSTLAERLKRESVPCVLFPVPGEFSKNRLWMHRVAIVQSVLERTQLNILHCDIDAYWLGDPRPMLAETSLWADIAFSQGTIWPQNALAQWSFVLCCGFFYLRNSPATRRFWQQVSHAVAKSQDDQIAVNETLLAWKTHWQTKATPSYRLTFRSLPMSCYCETLRGRTQTESLPVLHCALLPHRLFCRNAKDASEDTLVLHEI